MKNNTQYLVRARAERTGRYPSYDILDGDMRHVTNVDEDKVPLYARVITAFLSAHPNARIELRDCALYATGRGAIVRIHDHDCLRHSLWAADGTNLSPFWAIYDGLK